MRGVLQLLYIYIDDSRGWRDLCFHLKMTIMFYLRLIAVLKCRYD